jgi:EmrB/QacA subfamily drug resistance transporter
MTNPQGSPSAPVTSPARTMLPLLVVLFASFIDLVDATIVVVAAPAIKTSIDATDAQLQWIVAAYTLALGAGLITGGRLGDTYGRKRIFLIGLAAFAVTSALCALAVSPEMLIGFRAVEGLAAGIMVPQVFGIIRGSFNPAISAKAFGAYGAVQGLASVAGPLLGGFLVSANLFGLEWRSIFWINVPICVLALIIGIRVLPESRSESHARFDLVGAVLAAGGVLLLLLPLVQSTSWGWGAHSYLFLTGGIIVLTLFVIHERRLTIRGGEPVFDPRLLRNRAFSAGLIAAVLFFSGIGSLFLMLSVYLQYGTGRTPLETGLVILPYAIGSIVTSGIGVALAARVGRALLVTGSLIVAVSYLILWAIVRAGTDPGYWPLAAGLFAGGLGLGLVVPILVNIVLAGVPGRTAGSAGGVLSTVIQIGGAIGISTLSTAFFALANASPRASSVTRYGPAFGTVLLASAIIYVASALVMALLPKTAPSHD